MIAGDSSPPAVVLRWWAPGQSGEGSTVEVNGPRPPLISVGRTGGDLVLFATARDNDSGIRAVQIYRFSGASGWDGDQNWQQYPLQSGQPTWQATNATVTGGFGACSSAITSGTETIPNVWMPPGSGRVTDYDVQAKGVNGVGTVAETPWVHLEQRVVG